MTRLTRSPCWGPGQWSSGGWLNTTMSPAGTSDQGKNAFWTRMRSLTLRVGTMDVDGIQKVWNTNNRTSRATSPAARIVTAVSARVRSQRGRPEPGRAGPASAGPGSAGAGSAGAVMDGGRDDQRRPGPGRGHRGDKGGRAGAAMGPGPA